MTNEIRTNETDQEKTDRENFEHVQHIAHEVEAYAAGRVYKCPECGEVFILDYGDDTPDVCPCCGDECGADAFAQLSLYDYFDDALDIEYRVDAQLQYRSVCVMIACGGPNIYIDTGSKNVELYWWSDRAEYRLLSDAVEAIDEIFEEMFNCR